MAKVGNKVIQRRVLQQNPHYKQKYEPFTETITAGYVYVDPFIHNT